jgi:hypothetical protein
MSALAVSLLAASAASAQETPAPPQRVQSTESGVAQPPEAAEPTWPDVPELEEQAPPAPDRAAPTQAPDGKTAAQTVEPRRRRSRPSIPMLVGGSVSVTAGVLALLFGGASMSLAGSTTIDVCHEHAGCHVETVSAQERASARTMGWVGLIAGLGLTTAGVTLIVVGAKRRPDTHDTPIRAVEAFATGGGAGLRLRF